MITAIIPTLDEADGLADSVGSLRSAGLAEIIVVDGGSSDGTPQIAQDLGCKLLVGKKGRAAQMNEGAAEATGEVLLFLHGDTAVPVKTLQRLRSRMEADPSTVGGGFLRYFENGGWFLRVTCWLAGWRSRWWGLFLGDQGIFVRREIFEELGGFNESLPYGEDVDFSIRLREKGKTATIGPAVSSSARRFERLGPVRRTWEDFFIARDLIRESKKRIKAG